MSTAGRLRAAFLFGFASLGSWMPALTVWLEDHGLSKSRIGYVSAIPWLVMLIVQPIWGVAADRIGKKKCFIITSFVAVLAFVLMPAVGKDQGMIVGMTIAFALFNTPVLPLLDSITLDLAAGGRIRSYGTFRFWGAPGFAVGALLASWLTAVWNIDVIFYLSALFLLLMWLVLAALEVTSSSSAGEFSINGIGYLIKDGLLMTFLAVIALVSVAQSSSSFFLTVYLREIGSTPAVTGTALGVQSISELPFYFLAAWLLKKTSAGKVVLIAVFGTALRLLMYSLNQRAAWVIGIETMNGITWTLLWIASVDFVDKRVPAAWRTTGQSLLWAAYFGAGAIAGNIFSGRLYEMMPMRGVYGINSALATAAGLFAFVIFSLMRRRSLEKSFKTH